MTCCTASTDRNRKSPAFGAVLLKALDIAHAKKIDSSPSRSRASPVLAVEGHPGLVHFFVVPVAFDLKHPVGTGPFKFKSFTAGGRALS